MENRGDIDYRALSHAAPFPVAFQRSAFTVIHMATPKKLTAKDLVVGASYLHRNGLFVRHIDAVEGGRVMYHDQDSDGCCSKQVFLNLCPSLATAEDVAIAAQNRLAIDQATSGGKLTLRDEANAVTAYAFRNGLLEDLHAGKPSPLFDQPGYSRISDDEMKRLMIEASEKLAEMLRLKQQEPVKYDAFIRKYHRAYCRAWRRE